MKKIKIPSLQKSVTIIIRSKNEVKWIGSCLNSIKNQNYDNKKVEVIVLDNNSEDGTRNIAKKYKIKLINYNPKIYLPGSALNYAVKHAKNEIIVCLSAHCIPTTSNWLLNLVNSFEHDTAAVYGRQMPYSFSSFNDKRDLLNQFGLERRVQKKDNFFHNANSAILKSVLKQNPFNNKVLHIEDRIWAKNIIKKKYNIVYEPKASVWHYHGLNHSLDTERSIGVGKILENFVIKKSKSSAELFQTHNLLTIISHNPNQNSKSFFENLKKFKNSISDKFFLGDICVVTHSSNILSKIKDKLFFDAFFVKEKKLRTIKKIKKGLIEFQKKNDKIIDAVMIVDVDYILKGSSYYKKLFEKFFAENYDTVIPIKKDYGMYWKEQPNKNLIRLDDAGKLRVDKKPLYKSLSPVATVLSPELIYAEKRLGDKISCIIIQ